MPCCFLIINLKLHCLSKLLENMTYAAPLNYWVTPVMLAFDSLPWKGIMHGVELTTPVMNNFAVHSLKYSQKVAPVNHDILFQDLHKRFFCNSTHGSLLKAPIGKDAAYC